MNSNWHLYRRSLANHPGLPMATAWLLAVTFLIAPDFEAHPLWVMAALWVLGALILWAPVLITAWQLRYQYKEHEDD